ncbi:MAG: hypothetical protein MRERC_7c024 [Mycoplasmataceae bacterium RC_NB112A]|nr:MAG: hypothetical protein MRERC_8c024 [Mycoplasmataceae bacterium RC_NB112A]KLL01870.1 MAG: hypothetical protein MRERC_7c024 [Mycoplasmataceae bacterium RC_NB112A]
MIRKCSKCQKEISNGKFYSFYIGKKDRSLTSYKGGLFALLVQKKRNKRMKFISKIYIKLNEK